MRRLKFIAACLLIMVFLFPSLTYGEKINLKILYAGNPKTNREKDFVDFLEKHFVKVGKDNLKNFIGKTYDYDVVILDYDGDGFQAPRPMLQKSYTTPTITVGVAGALLGNTLHLKTNYT